MTYHLRSCIAIIVPCTPQERTAAARQYITAVKKGYPAKSEILWGRGGTAERMSFRACHGSDRAVLVPTKW
ncbi:MAG: hypothetical protein IJS94_06660 [Clostridia bacterium]|nr:hypothetical protein [Clostridia bacterium]